MSDYLSVLYDEKLKPYTEYPAQLAAHLAKQFDFKPEMKLLEVGPGRGEMLSGFSKLGIEVSGVDISESAKEYSPDYSVKVANVEEEGLPYEDNEFDIIYSKSFLEHLNCPEKFMKEANRVLKPGGILVNLVPDWDTQYRTYFDDHTHKSPFTKVSLRNIFKIHGFCEINVTKLRELPAVWKYPFLNYLCDVIAPLTPIRSKVKLFKWSRRLMLVGSGKKCAEQFN